MEVLYFLIPLAALLSGLIVAALVWAVRAGQFEDLEGPAHRILMEEDSPRPPDGAERRAAGGDADSRRSPGSGGEGRIS